MAGQLLGISSKEIDRLMPDIELFAEIGCYLDQPVRVYSSGMQMRLAFSVATAIRPDILIVDEALSVGDAYFQHKSFGRIREFRKQGTTLLIVSHDKAAIQNICDHAILLSSGRLVMRGEPETVMDYYNAMLANHQNQVVKQVILPDGKIQTISGTGEASVEDIGLLDNKNRRVQVVKVGASVTLRVNVRISSDLERLVLGYSIKDRLGQVIYGTNTDLTKQPLTCIKAGSLIQYEINFNVNLGSGTYSIQTALVSSETHMQNNYEWRDLALIFNVINYDDQNFVGLAWLPASIKIIQL